MGMPLLRYFVFVGGALLALLFISDAVLPQVPLPGNLTSGSDLPAVRIRSERKWPDRIVIDTSVPMSAGVAVAKADVAPASPAAVDGSAKVREAFAQLPEPKQPGAKTAATEPNKIEVKPQPKRKVARAHPVSRPVMIAQQPRFGLFGTTW
jgi:hypothetical protein